MARSTTTSIAQAEERRIAIHEAGHAVAHFMHGHVIKRVSIINDEESLGRVIPGKLPAWVRPDIEVDGRTRLRLERSIIESMAGEAALAVAGDNDPRDSGDVDRSVAFDYAALMFSDVEEIDAYLAWLRIHTRNLLSGRGNRNLVEVLSDELLRRKEMTGREVKAFLYAYNEARYAHNEAKAVIVTRKGQA